MKKLKANAIVTTFVLTLCLLLLGIFGTDTAYIVLSRFKLQKVAEAIALEYASSLAKSIDGNDNIDQCQDIIKDFLNVYSTQNSGILGLEVNGIEYKIKNDGAYVRARITSSVLPAFLRYIGVRGIKVHAIAYAKTNKINIQKQTTEFPDDNGMVEFDLANEMLLNPHKGVPPVITNKMRGQGDFAIKLEYDNSNGSYPHWRQRLTNKGGFYIFGSYKSNDRWAELAHYATDNSIIKQGAPIDITGRGGLLCIDSSRLDNVTFSLNDKIDANTYGFTNKVDKIRVYISEGVAQNFEPTPSTGLPPAYWVHNPFLRFQSLDPCSPFSCAHTMYQQQCGEYKRRPATVTLTILNDVKLISKFEFQTAAGSNTGTCTSNP